MSTSCLLEQHGSERPDTSPAPAFPPDRGAPGATRPRKNELENASLRSTSVEKISASPETGAGTPRAAFAFGGQPQGFSIQRRKIMSRTRFAGLLAGALLVPQAAVGNDTVPLPPIAYAQTIP